MNGWIFPRGSGIDDVATYPRLMVRTYFCHYHFFLLLAHGKNRCSCSFYPPFTNFVGAIDGLKSLKYVVDDSLRPGLKSLKLVKSFHPAPSVVKS